MLSIAGSVVALAVLLGLAIRLTTFHPPAEQAEQVSCSAHAPVLQAGQTLTLMTWNVQYMAGKDYVFWYDVIDGSGPDVRPSAKAITRTFGEVARVIGDVQPDLIFLQEVHEGAKTSNIRHSTSNFEVLENIEHSTANLERSKLDVRRS